MMSDARAPKDDQVPFVVAVTQRNSGTLFYEEGIAKAPAF